MRRGSKRRSKPSNAETAFTEFADTQGALDFSAIYKTLRALPEGD